MYVFVRCFVPRSYATSTTSTMIASPMDPARRREAGRGTAPNSAGEIPPAGTDERGDELRHVCCWPPLAPAHAGMAHSKSLTNFFIAPSKWTHPSSTEGSRSNEGCKLWHFDKLTLFPLSLTYAFTNGVKYKTPRAGRLTSHRDILRLEHWSRLKRHV